MENEREVWGSGERGAGGVENEGWEERRWVVETTVKRYQQRKKKIEELFFFTETGFTYINNTNNKIHAQLMPGRQDWY